MALSNQVKESVDQATNHLREALAFAARSEHSMVISMLTDLISRCETLESMEELMQRFDPGKTTTPFNMPGEFGK
jgi:hypothetical protein